MNGRTKLYAALHTIGWTVVMPVLVVLLVGPFTDFRDWTGRALDDQAQAARLVPVYPRLRATFGVSVAAPARLEEDIAAVFAPRRAAAVPALRRTPAEPHGKPDRPAPQPQPEPQQEPPGQGPDRPGKPDKDQTPGKPQDRGPDQAGKDGGPEGLDRQSGVRPPTRGRDRD